MTLDEALADARATARRLRGQVITTIARGELNTITEVSDEGVMVKARTDALVPWEMIDSVIQYLSRRRTIVGPDLKRDGIRGQYRSAFIFAFLSRCDFAEAATAGRVRTLRWVN